MDTDTLLLMLLQGDFFLLLQVSVCFVKNKSLHSSSILLLKVIKYFSLKSGVDPGLPAWGGVTNLGHWYFLARTYAKMKDLGPVLGGGLGAPPNPQ